MPRLCFAILLAACLQLAGCGSPLRTEIPPALAAWDEDFKAVLEGLSPTERQLFLDFIQRHQRDPASGELSLPAHLTVAEALADQRNWQAKLASLATRKGAERTAGGTAIAALPDQLTVKVARLTIETSGTEHRLALQGRLHNGSHERLAQLQGVLLVRDAQGEELARLPLNHAPLLEPGTGTEWQVSRPLDAAELARLGGTPKAEAVRFVLERVRTVATPG